MSAFGPHRVIALPRGNSCAFGVKRTWHKRRSRIPPPGRFAAPSPASGGGIRGCGALTSFLRDHGAEAVSVADLGYVFSKDNPLYAKLEAGL